MILDILYRPEMIDTMLIATQRQADFEQEGDEEISGED
jgi:hypothetical protein